MAAFEDLKGKLREIFQLDRTDLDFGLYRIMNLKSEEVSKFIEEDLLPQVKNGLKEYSNFDYAEIQSELEKTIEQSKELGLSDEQIENLPKIKDLKSKLVSVISTDKLENEIYSDLYNFFKRYYSEGDFMSLRRYKEGVYALPYEGEEVKLHWANADQYYIKSSETFSNYTFKIRGKKIRFEVVDATTEQNNNKDDKNRRFRLYKGTEEEPKNSVSIRNGEFVVAFTYLATEGSAPTQKNINDEIFAELWANPLLVDIAESLKTTTSDKSHLPILQKHINNFTAKNTFDYFIHKDLRGFLNRELDFFIKNEIMHLDDIENEPAAKVEQYLGKIKVLRTVAHKIIDFLASIENFQKKLWLKKKFVLETNYCITLDRVPEELYPEIVANNAQRDEWIKLFAIDEIKGEELGSVAYSNPLTIEFLKANPFLVLDTQFFSTEFKYKLLSSIDNLDEKSNGLLIHSENFQALELIREKYKSKISTIYIDPPFNLKSNSDLLYRTDYLNSTWLQLLYDRLSLTRSLVDTDAIIFIRCDYHGPHLIRYLIESLGWEMKSEIYIDRSRNEAGSANKMEVTVEHLFLCSNPNSSIKKYTVPRSVANIKWTGFLMAGDRNPPERSFLGKVILPPKGQHWSLIQEKIDRILNEYHLRLKCKKCGAYYYKDVSDESLSNNMKKNSNRFKFYDITRTTKVHGVTSLTSCKDCGCEEFRVEYLGSGDVYINDRWLDIPSYSRRWGFPSENSEELLERVVRFSEGPILDFFAGSGTTGAVAEKMSRPWIMVDVGGYVNTITLSRIKMILHGDPSGITNSYKIKRGGMFKYIRLESYEDCLDNLKFERSKTQEDWLENNKTGKEEYMLKYMMDLETKDSLLSIKKFDDPFGYKINITRDGEVKESNVDLVETFNYLIGLYVDHIQTFKDILVVEGVTREGEKTLVIWRNTSKTDSDALDSWFKKCKYSTLDAEFDVIYVNGDNNLENLRRDDQTWKVRLIEAEFNKRMFDVQDVK